MNGTLTHLHITQRLLFCFFAALLSAPAAVHAGCTIYVSHTDDPPLAGTITGDRDDKMTFREAAAVGFGNARCYSNFERARIVDANFVTDFVFCQTATASLANRLSVGNPGCGPSDADTIRFLDSMVGGGYVINLAGVVEIDSIDGIAGEPVTPLLRPNIVLHGPGAIGASNGGIVVEAVDNFGVATGTIKNITIENFGGFGIYADAVDGLKVFGVTISGISSVNSFLSGNGIMLGKSFSTLATVFNAQIGGTGAGQQNYFYGIAGTGVLIEDGHPADPTDRNNKVFNNYLGLCEELDTGIGLGACLDGTPNQGIGYGVRVKNTNGTRIGGAGANERNYMDRAAVAGVYLEGTETHANFVRGNWIGLSATGIPRANDRGVMIVSGAYANTVGGAAAGEGNVVSGNSNHGVYVYSGDGNVVAGNIVGLNANRTQIAGNGQDGIALGGTSTNSRVRDNVISGNASWGVYLGATVGTLLERNTIGLRGPTNNANDTTTAANLNGGIWIDSGPSNGVGLGNLIAGNSGPGVLISGENADNNVVNGNVIGLAADNLSHPNTGGGIVLQGGADQNTIGGTTSSDRNVISGNNLAGVRISGNATTNNTIRGNYVGIDPSGATARQNQNEGIVLQQGTQNNIVRGNLASGNGNDGIKLDSGALTNSLLNNSVGYDAAGTHVVPNLASGISILAGSTGNSIGDKFSPFGFNIIAGNAGAGIFIADPGTSTNGVYANIIGYPGFPNGAGVVITASATGSELISNAIAMNNGIGILVSGAATTGHSFRSNTIGPNNGLGIDLAGNGVSANDAGDADTGPNGLQNFPTVSNVVRGSNMLSLTLGLNSSPNTTFGFDVFASPACDASLNGEGVNFVGATAATTGGNNLATVNSMLPLADTVNASVITATATNPGNNTSEFSACVAVNNTSDLIFASGFDVGSIILAVARVFADAEAALAATTHTQSTGTYGFTAGGTASVKRAASNRVVLTLDYSNRSNYHENPRRVAIGTDQPVAIERIDATGMRCVLAGAIVCDVGHRAPGDSATVAITLMPMDDSALGIRVASQTQGVDEQLDLSSGSATW